MKISETFHSIQGEGHLTGKPMFFIRAQGCSVKCPIREVCDQPESLVFRGGTEHAPATLAEMALAALGPRGWVSITGGEPLDQPDFDRLAIQTSRVEPMGSQEQYRIGKSLRKKGINSDALLAELAQIETSVNQQLADWLATGGEIRRSRAGEAIIDSRYWHCMLEGKEVTIPCGGTHVSTLAELGQVRVQLAPCEEGFTLTTRVAP
jgi:alanyl-tRNA synthetase